MTAPPYRIEYRSDDGILRAHVTGTTDSLQTTVAYWTDMAGEVRRQAPDHLLVLHEMDGPTLPRQEMLRFVQAMQGGGLERIRIAFVEASLAKLPHMEHAEIFAREHGFSARVFGNEMDARVWLRHGDR